MATSVTLKPNAIDISGSTSGTTTLQASAVAGTTTLTLPAATDTLVGKATTDTLTNKTLTGAVMNGTLGATTPSTASVTTLTTSSTVTHSGGTANCVAYLDGSKVLTTGSALVFDGTNLGLGVTPSAWASGFKTIQLGAITAVTGAGTTANFSANQYWNGTNNIYLTSAAATLYQQSAGAHYWYNAASGTAGNAISFTQAMTLDASGNLGVGNTSPAARIDAFRSTVGTYFLGGGGDNVARQLAITSSTTTNSGDTHTFNAQSGTGVIAFATTGTERARIKAAGEISSTSAGDFGIRTAVTAGAGTTTGIFVGARSATAGNTNSGTDTFIVWSNGNVVNTNNSYGAISDVKLKENIVDATPKLEKLNQVRVVNYNFIGDQQKQLGVIAQELEQVFPGMIDESPDKDAEGNDLGTTTKSVKYSVFVPMLIKALQEQQAIIQSLTARITALESA